VRSCRSVWPSWPAASRSSASAARPSRSQGAKDRVDDALNATRAAVEEGIVPGGGTLCCAPRAVGPLTTDNADVKAGINIVLRALEAPIRQIAENSGVEGSIVVGKILTEGPDTFGFNAQTETYVDMIARPASSIRPRWCARHCRTPPRSPACWSPPRPWSPRLPEGY
jgi:hypothetical protein